MLRDAQEELQRLNEELLKQDEKQEYSNEKKIDHRRIYNAGRHDVDLEEFSQQVEEEPEKGVGGLLVLAFVLLTGIFCVLAYLVLYSKGWLG